MERIGISQVFPISLLKESVGYIKDSSRILSLGIEGEICKEVRNLYYTGYSDLSPEEGVVQILKDIESVLDPKFISLLNKAEQHLNKRIIDINIYSVVLNSVSNTLSSYVTRNRQRIKSMANLNQIQLMDPLFKRKYSQRKFKYKPKKKAKINNIAIIQDTTSSMLHAGNIEKLIAVVDSAKRIFKNSTVTKYNAQFNYCIKTLIDYYPPTGVATLFKLEFYLDAVSGYDLIIVCTDASDTEFNLEEVKTPTIIFNLGESKYPTINNVKVIQI